MVVAIEDAAETTEGAYRCFYLRMELLEELNAYMARCGLGAEALYAMGRDIAEALTYLHGAGMVHRDIKPANVFVSARGRFLLGDFGISTGLGESTRAGTASCLAPEVYREGRADARSDIYALGLMLYRLSNRGRDPFLDVAKQLVTRQEREEALAKRLLGASLPPAADATPELNAILLRCLAYAPKERFATAEELREAFCALLPGGEEKEQEDVLPQEKSGRRSWRALPIAAVISLVLAVCLGLAVLQAGTKSRREGEGADGVQELRVGIVGNRIPYAYALPADGEEQLTGCDVRLAGYLADALSASLVLLPLENDAQAPQDCDILLAGFSAYAPTPKGYVHTVGFAEGSGESTYSIFVRSTEAQNYRNGASLKEAGLCVLQGGLEPSLLQERFPRADIREVGSLAEAGERILDGSADAFLVPAKEADAWLPYRPSGLRLVPIGLMLPAPPPAAAVREGEDALLSQVDQAFRTLRENGTYDVWKQEETEEIRTSILSGTTDTE